MHKRGEVEPDEGGFGSGAARPDVPGARLGLIVVNYSSSGLLERHLVGLSQQAQGVVVVVVDNFSSLQERRRIVELSRSHAWVAVALPDNRGFGPGVDAGVEAAKRQGCTEVLLLNPDAIATPEAVARLWEHCREVPDSMVSPVIKTSTGSIYSRGSGLQLWNGFVVRLEEGQREASGVIHARSSGPRRVVVPWLTAACVAMPVGVFDRIGGMDDHYFMYWEDVDLSFRASLHGVKLIVREDITVIHDEGGTQETRFRGKSGLYYYYNSRNRLLFGARHVERRLLVRWLFATPRASWRILMRGGRRQLVQSPQPAWQIFKGSMVGLWLATGVVARTLIVSPGKKRTGAGTAPVGDR